MQNQLWSYGTNIWFVELVGFVGLVECASFRWSFLIERLKAIRDQRRIRNWRQAFGTIIITHKRSFIKYQMLTWMSFQGCSGSSFSLRPYVEVLENGSWQLWVKAIKVDSQRRSDQCSSSSDLLRLIALWFQSQGILIVGVLASVANRFCWRQHWYQWRYVVQDREECFAPHLQFLM